MIQNQDEKTYLPIAPIVDSHGRVHRSLRISVTDRCNIRCFYCMPENVKFLPQDSILNFEEIHRVVQILAHQGVSRVRLTGGEPLVRSELWNLVKLLKSTPGIDEVALTTNGILLGEQAQKLKSSGLDRINVSLDSIDPEKFKEITRRDALDKVLAGIDAAVEAGFDNIRINAVSVKGISETEVIPLVSWAQQQSLHLRFIEFMPLDGDQAWQDQQVLTGAMLRSIIETKFGSLIPVRRGHASQPATDFQLSDGAASIGFIDSVTEPFCQSCDRMRITAEGKLRNCLFSTEEWDLKELIRSNASDAQIEEQIRLGIRHKKLGHGSDTGRFVRPERAMYQIGG
ncbi:MAG: GTP 3',8-cyclase MoaA [Planctomycetaceae bacterium]|nr:GTP 3',8-cyclase MoaA [Planctomycetaceae bacterium]